MTAMSRRRQRRLLAYVVMAAMAIALLIVLGNIARLLLDRHDAADRCRAAGYTWLGGYVNRCIDAHEVHP